MIRLRDIRSKAIGQLKEIGSDSPGLDVDLLLEQALDLSPLDIMLEPDRQVSEAKEQVFQDLLRRRLAREPISQILGQKDFWSLTFKVSRDCLTPRPDSETLIEAALKAIPDRTKPLKILDFGTGSGCLLLSLMSEFPHSTGVGVDLSPKALACAQENAERLGFLDRCDFILSDWAEKLPSSAGFDVILCNPPYIGQSEKPDLAPEVHDYEPHMALFAEEEGRREYKRLAEVLPNLVAEGACVFLEIGHKQGVEIVDVFSKGGAKNIRILKDLAGRDRCIALNY
ncbi:MAG: peptide chain release factor N(5)-glutamine methyltransferase [Emcibacter sp.]|nr:peptide chain release factor N(5)-glutamine methyltransferase [Emcibacter sp.]